MDDLPSSSNNEPEASPIAGPSISKTPDHVKITDIVSIPSKKPRMAVRKRGSHENLHSEILTASPQRRKLQEKQKKTEEKKKQNILKKRLQADLLKNMCKKKNILQNIFVTVVIFFIVLIF